MARLGFLHTAHVHVPTFEALVRDADDSSSCVHRVDPELLERARGSGVTAELEQATLVELQHLAGEGADVVICTCSTLGAIAEGLQAHLSVPVVRVDRAMARAAVRTGPRIAVVAALRSTLEPTRALLAAEARREDVSPTIVDVVVPEAWAAFEAGASDDYLTQIAEAARSVAESVNVVVLAQASMMGAIGALADVRTPVLASPALAVDYALRESGRSR